MTAEVQAKIIAYVRAGAYIETAALASGITKQTFYEFLRKANNQKEGKLREFLDSINKAVAESELISINNIAKAGAAGVWQAEAWRLERKNPDRWGRKERYDIEHSGPGGAPIVTQAPQIIISLPSNGYRAEEQETVTIEEKK
jgi:hypothetical protein